MADDLERFLSEYRRARPAGREAVVMAAGVESTNLLARRIAGVYQRQSELPPWCLVAALEQWAGRGRLGRRWVSPRGLGVYATLLIPAVEAADLQRLPLVSAVAICRELNRITRRRCGVKWPNDLVIEGKKLGGILIEVVGREGESASAAVGVGVNLAMSESELPTEGATSLRMECERPPGAGELTAALVSAVEEEWRRRGDLDAMVASYRRCLVHQRGDLLRAATPQGEVEGAFQGVDERGFLRLLRNGKELVVGAGELVEE